MDPSFLRDAVTDANGAHAVASTSLRTVWLRLLAAAHAFGAVLRRH